jgi:hypothetical protein
MEKELTGWRNETARVTYLETYLGPVHLPYQSLIPMTVVYSLIFISGLIGNFSTCIVIYKAHYMRTSTNYYLFNLAIADMLTLIFGKFCLLSTAGRTLFVEVFLSLFLRSGFQGRQVSGATKESPAKKNNIIIMSS